MYIFCTIFSECNEQAANWPASPDWGGIKCYVRGTLWLQHFNVIWNENKVKTFFYKLLSLSSLSHFTFPSFACNLSYFKIILFHLFFSFLSLILRIIFKPSQMTWTIIVFDLFSYFRAFFEILPKCQ